jgi:hypothetical protein
MDALVLQQWLSQDDRYILGMQWNGIPIGHNILRDEYWIYNEKIDKTVIFMVFVTSLCEQLYLLMPMPSYWSGKLWTF